MLELLRSSRALAALAVLATSSACLPCCGDTQAGSAEAEATVEPLAFTRDGEWVPLEEGSTFPTVIGGQGFTMLVVGARATNVDTCGVRVHATLTDLSSAQQVADVENERNLVMVDETSAESRDENGSDGVQVIGQFYDRCGPQPVRLDLTITDRTGKTAHASRTGTWVQERPWDPCPDAGTDAGTDGGD